jgi:hypothetical protein
MRRSRGRTALAIVLGILGATALVEMLLTLAGVVDDPRPLAVFQGCMAVTAIAGAVGSWRMSRWAPVAALLYGAVTTSMLLVLGPLINLDAEARRGLLSGAASALLFALWAAWYLRRSWRVAATMRAGSST